MPRRRDFDPVFVSEFNRLLTETIVLGADPDRALHWREVAIGIWLEKDEDRRKREQELA